MSMGQEPSEPGIPSGEHSTDLAKEETPVEETPENVEGMEGGPWINESYVEGVYAEKVRFALVSDDAARQERLFHLLEAHLQFPKDDMTEGASGMLRAYTALLRPAVTPTETVPDGASDPELLAWARAGLRGFETE